MDYRQVIESKYNRKKWQELLHDIFRKEVTFWTQPQPVILHNDDTAKKALYLGKINLSDGNIIAIYEVELSDSVVIERNRASIRNLLCTNWRGMGCAGAFMFCFRQNEASLRFSYVSESFVFVEDGSLKRESTDTKRFTYLLGEGHRSRTAIEQFKTLQKSNHTLIDVTKAFSVEALSDMFFEGYKAHYENIVEFITGKRMVKEGNKWKEKVTGQPNQTIMQGFQKFPNPEKAVRDYVKKLMGRLVFLQFLQKKGWMGCPAGDEWCGGDKEFLQNLFSHSKYKDTFVGNILEPIFNDINTKRNGDMVSNPDIGSNIKIPYLNGGLFEKDKFDHVSFPLPAKFMKDMLHFFASYNFTIDENDPDDAEIGVDPEMLGRIFENLLEDNKDKGAFYTPKEIVQYMCRESLIAYLQTDITDEAQKNSIRNFVTTHERAILSDDLKVKIDQKLKDVKICDPAIGSGAFPMGLLRELYSCRKAIEGIDDDTAVSIKTHIIQNNIYGVDIEKGAVDIARLRFWLALIVDEKTPHALPNMDFKIMQGNSLLEQYEGIDLSGMSANEVAEKNAKKKGHTWQQTLAFDEQDALKNIQHAIKEYYLTDVHEDKEKLRDIINNNVRSYILNIKGFTPDIKKKLENLPIPNDKFFLWHIYFKEVFDKGGFDIVIGNPPYIKEYENKKAFDGFRESSPYYMGKMDIWHGFVCFSIDLLKEHGTLAFIAQNNWTTNSGAKLMRRKIISDARIIQMIDFNDYMVFGESASIQTMVMIFAKNQDSNNYVIDYRKQKPNTGKEGMLQMLNGGGEHLYLKPVFNRETFANKYITFSIHDEILNKLASFPARLQKEEVAQGIVFPQDFLNEKGQALIPSHNIGDGIFGLSQEELNNLHLSENEKSLIKPYYTTDQIHRYYTDEGKNSLWMIYTRSEFKNECLMNSYPNLKRHIDQFREILTSDNKPYGIHRARDSKFFTGKKIISLRKCSDRPLFSYSESDCYVTQTFFSIKTNRWNMKFLTGVLNSRLLKFWLLNKGKMQGVNYQVDKEPLLGIPLPDESCRQTDIISLVDTIINTKTQNAFADISALEIAIDKIVYKLYNLTPEEIDIVENATK